MNDLRDDVATSESKRYVVGPMVTIPVPFGFNVEIDWLYRRTSFRLTSSDLLTTYFRRDVGNSWEFPVVLRRTLWRQFYAGLGYAPRFINGRSHVHTLSSNDPDTLAGTESDTPGRWLATSGVVTEAGFEKRVGPLRFAPEVRYIRWNRPTIEDPLPRGSTRIVSSQNQVDIFLGVSLPFGGR